MQYANQLRQQMGSPRRGRPPNQPIASSSKYPAGHDYPPSHPKKRISKPKKLNGHRSKSSQAGQRNSSVETNYIKPPPDDYCSFCHGNDLRNKVGKPDKMVSCSVCGQSGHPTCLNMEGKLAKRVFTYDWVCLNCKVCEVCTVKGEDVGLVSRVATKLIRRTI
jgi:hypothetical protein